MVLFAKKTALFALALVSVSANADVGPYYVCSPLSISIGIPEEKNELVISGPSRQGAYQAQLDAVDFINDTRRNLWTAYVHNTGNAAYPVFVGNTADHQVVSISVTKNPRTGRIGLFAPTYTAVLEVGNSERQEWFCHSPRDPQ